MTTKEAATFVVILYAEARQLGIRDSENAYAEAVSLAVAALGREENELVER